MIEFKQYLTNPLGFDSHALPPFCYIKSNGSMLGNHTKTIQFEIPTRQGGDILMLTIAGGHGSTGNARFCGHTGFVVGWGIGKNRVE